MLKLTLLLLCTIGGYTRGDGLERGPQPGEGEAALEKKPSKRQFLFPQIQQQYPQIQQQYSQIQQQCPFVPIYIPVPQVVEVHHVVMLQPPQCPPVQQPYPPPTQPPPFRPPTQPPMTDDGLGDRVGNMNNTMSMKPSRCVWAIVACCSPESTNIRYSCFELLGCPGAFWGINPCEPKVVQAAANTALNFYMAGGTDEGAVSNNNI